MSSAKQHMYCSLSSSFITKVSTFVIRTTRCPMMTSVVRVWRRSRSLGEQSAACGHPSVAGRSMDQRFCSLQAITDASGWSDVKLMIITRDLQGKAWGLLWHNGGGLPGGTPGRHRERLRGDAGQLLEGHPLPQTEGWPAALPPSVLSF